MDRTAAQATAYMGDVIYTWLESNAAAYNVGFEFLPEQSPALMLQSQTSDPVVKRYKSGRTRYRYSFALYLRMDNTDTASRINNQRELQAIASSLMEADLTPAEFKTWDMEQDSTVRVMLTEEGRDVCFTSLHIDYERTV